MHKFLKIKIQKMKKVLLGLLLVTGLSVFNSQAQMQVGAFGTYNKLLGDAGDGAPAGFGGGVDFKYFVSKKFALGANLGYISHSQEEEFFGIKTKVTTTILPITVNAQYFFTEEGFRPYAGMGLGLYGLGGSLEVAGASEDFETQNEFGLAPHVGAQYFFNESVGLDLNLKYHYIMTEEEATTAFGVNLGLVFQFGGK